MSIKSLVWKVSRYKSQREEALQRDSYIAHMKVLKCALPFWPWCHSGLKRTANWSICLLFWTRRGLLKLKVPMPAHLMLSDIYVKITESTFWGWTDLISSENDIRGAICHSQPRPDGGGARRAELKHVKPMLSWAGSLSGEENKTYVGVKGSERTPLVLVIKSQGSM